jgi:ABC-type lipoprotein export system ATPase subunit
LRGICKSYGIGKDRLVRAAHDVSLTIEAGAFVALTGASGSGKSTLLHLIGAIERPDSGTVAGGLLVTTTAALLPAQALRRLPAAHLLAEE